MPSVIKWPHGAKAQEKSDAFGDITRFLNILGAVDGSHIPIKAPRENPNGYYNRKNVSFSGTLSNMCCKFVTRMFGRAIQVAPMMHLIILIVC